ncbi:FERM, ARHGEF and pleckstrin domain-containing protein 2-like isoform X2 [Ptychodera flava]|uniref:FERM, ARHGEF and pleckstrin domain-containing protein 2-like isoform X2 n=1 Tax=Ptychodera flava TaxID=63121 RepID=UPI003969D8F8
MNDFEREERAASSHGSPTSTLHSANHTDFSSRDHFSDDPSSAATSPVPSSPTKSEPSSPRREQLRKRGKLISVRVLMLDDQTQTFEVQKEGPGRELFDACCHAQGLFESDYFGVEFTHKGKDIWLELEKPILRQVGSPKKTICRFVVKFYNPDPGQLQDEFTKYLFALQVKRDLSLGRLPCSDNTVALLASYILQAEVGDYTPQEHDNGRYITMFKFVPNQTRPIEAKIQEYHKNHIGQTPADADFNLLDIARRLEMYGVRLYSAKDHEGVRLDLAVAHMGVLVFCNGTKINTFSWAKVRKLSFKRKRFLIKLHQEGYGYYKDTVEFFLSSRNEAKRFWKICVEHHTFFRMQEPKIPKGRSRVFSRGSTFRYSGRTQKQVIDAIRQSYKKPSFVSRHPSSRISSRSLGAPRTTTPLRFEAADNSVIERPTVSTPELNYLQSSRSGNGQLHNSLTLSPTLRDPSPGFTPTSSTPVTPEANARISVRPATSSGSMVYEYTVNEELKGDHTDGIDTDESKPSANYINQTVVVTQNKLQDYNSETLGGDYINQSATHEYMNAGSMHDYINQESLPVARSPTTPREPEKTEVVVHANPTKQETKIETSVITTSGKTISDEGGGSQGSQEETDGTRRKVSGVELLKRHPTDKAYFIAKEILTTERTYIKDLEVIVVWFRKAAMKESGMPSSVLDLLFNNLDPIYDFHCGFVKEVEQRLATWEGRSNAHLKGNYQRIGDIMEKNMKEIKLYTGYMQKHDEILTELEMATRRSKKFELVYKEFELQKVCYLPFNTFLLKPVQRLLHYKLILERLLKHYPASHADYENCQTALEEVTEATSHVHESMKKLENFQKLTELQRDLVGIENLVQPGREFIREGCLHKLSRKGYQQRMFFLFSDMLIYTSKGVTATNQFKVHGQIPLKGIVIEDNSQQERSSPYCFTIYGGSKTLVLAASSEQEKEKWMADIKTAMAMAQKQNKSMESIGSSDASFDTENALDESEEDIQSPRGSLERQTHHRANTTMHVCWHRNTSVSMTDHARGVENQLSGYLLRKFKNSNGWQKLWVVFTNFCLFFYKTYQDDFPLASLPLLGYTVSVPGERDGIQKDYVFKLQFKTHVYFFRAESEYTFGRWMEVLGSATYSSKFTQE